MVKPSSAGQHDVEHDQVVLVVAVAQARLGKAAVAQRVDGVAFLFEAALESAGELVGIFDDEESHDAILLATRRAEDRDRVPAAVSCPRRAPARRTHADRRQEVGVVARPLVR